MLESLLGTIRLEWVVAMVLVGVLIRAASRPIKWIALSLAVGLLLGVVDGATVMGLVRQGIAVASGLVETIATSLARPA